MKTTLDEIQKLCNWYRTNDEGRITVSPKILQAGENNELLYFSSETEILVNLVVPFFKYLGWNSKNFMFEYFISGEGKKIDLLLTDNSRKTIFGFIEAKKLSRTNVKEKKVDEFKTEKIYEQVYSYYHAIQSGLGDKEFTLLSNPLLILTNGDDYHIYRPDETNPLLKFKITSHTEEELNKMKELLGYDTSRFDKLALA